MEAGKLIQEEATPSPAAAQVKVNDCWTKKNENATFLEDLKDHFDDFIHKSVEGHMNCLKSKMEKVNSYLNQLHSPPYPSYLSYRECHRDLHLHLHLHPQPNGTISGNASQVSDGAGAVMKRSLAMQKGLPILGVFSFAAVGVDPAVMGVDPAVAIPAAVKAAGLQIEDIDLFEINEAVFSASKKSSVIAAEANGAKPVESTSVTAQAQATASV